MSWNYLRYLVLVSSTLSLLLWTPPAPATGGSRGMGEVYRGARGCNSDQQSADPCGLTEDPCAQSLCRAHRACISFMGRDSEGGMFSHSGLIALINQGGQVMLALNGSDDLAKQCRQQKNHGMLVSALAAGFLFACTAARQNCIDSCREQRGGDEEAVVDLSPIRDPAVCRQQHGNLHCTTTAEVEVDCPAGFTTNTATHTFTHCHPTPVASVATGTPPPDGARCQRSMADRAYDKCDGFAQEVQQAQGQLMVAAQNALQAYGCEQSSEDQQDAMAQFCAQNPTLVECGGDGSIDCNNPRNARLLECLCRNPDQQRTNPACNPNSVAGSGIGSGGAFANGSPYGDPFANMGDVGSLDTMLGLQDPAAGGNFDQQPGQGGSAMNSNRGAGPQQGGGANSAMGARPGGGQAVAAAAPALGLSGGGGGSAIAMGFNDNGGMGSSGDRRPASKDEEQGLDLSKLLPGADRKLAGMTLPATDGITGPMGPSVWEKVSARYRLVKVQRQLQP